MKTHFNTKFFSDKHKKQNQSEAQALNSRLSEERETQMRGLGQSSQQPEMLKFGTTLNGFFFLIWMLNLEVLPALS